MEKKLVNFSSKTMDFEISIHPDFSLVISNERIEYFCSELLSKNFDISRLIKECSVIIMGNYDNNKIQQYFMVESNRCLLYNEIQNCITDAIIICDNNKDFPRHPFPKSFTDKLIKKCNNDNADLNQKVIIQQVRVDCECDVSKVFNRYVFINKFKQTFTNQIKPIIESDSKKVNFFIVTEIGTDSEEQKHSFLLINYKNNFFLFDSAGHEKLGYGLKKTDKGIQETGIIGFDDMSNTAMLLDYIKADKNRMLYYNHNRIQADHVNCFTFALDTIYNCCNRIRNCKEIDEFINYLTNFFPVDVEKQIACEGSLNIINEIRQNITNTNDNISQFKEFNNRLILPAEFLVNTQLKCSFLDKAKTFAGNTFNNNTEILFNKSLEKELEENIEIGCIRNNMNDFREKEQLRRIDKIRHKYLSYVL